MIEYLRGKVLKKTDGHVVLDVNGVGYGLDVPATAIAAFPGVGDEAEAWVHTYVQEAVLRLYGFPTERERELFEVFLGAQGIGPRIALGILSAIDPASFARALLAGDLRTLTKIPGIGKKTAERLAVDLRDKIKPYATGAAGTALGVSASSGAGEDGEAGLSAGSGGAGGELAVAGIAVREAIEALEALGVKPLVAERAARKASDILGPQATVAELVREGLKHRR